MQDTLNIDIDIIAKNLVLVCAIKKGHHTTTPCMQHDLYNLREGPHLVCMVFTLAIGISNTQQCILLRDKVVQCLINLYFSLDIKTTYLKVNIWS